MFLNYASLAMSLTVIFDPFVVSEDDTWMPKHEVQGLVRLRTAVYQKYLLTSEYRRCHSVGNTV